MAILPKFARQSRAKDADIHEKPKPQKSKSNEMSDRTQLDHSGSDDLSQVSQSAKNEGLDEEEKQVNTAEDGVIVRLTKLKLSAVVIALCLAIFCQALDNTIIATAIPKITDDFGALDDIGWYGSSYLLATCALQLSYGKIYTFFSIKWVFLVALGLFELGSLVCGAAPTSTAFIVGRAVAGAGSAGLFSGSTIVISYTVPLPKRPIFFGIFGSMYALASVAGPLLGGAFTDRVTWRLCFYINLPFGLITAIVIILFFPSPPKPGDSSLSIRQKLLKLDPLGVIIFVPGIVSLLLALQWGGSKYAWDSGRIIALLVLFGVLIIAFVAMQWRAGKDATVPATIIRQRTIWAMSWYSLFLFGSFLATLYYIPLWFQAIKEVSPLTSGIDNLPLILATTFFTLFAGGLVTAVGYYTWACILASIISAVGAGLLTTFEVDTGSPHWIGYQFLYGAGIGLGLQQPLVGVQATLSQDDVPVGTAILIFMQTFGGAIFVSVAQNIFSNTLLENVKTENIPVNPTLLLGTGATSLVGLVPESSLEQLKVAYNKTVTETFYIAVATAALSFFGSILIPWNSVKSPKAKRED